MDFPSIKTKFGEVRGGWQFTLKGNIAVSLVEKWGTVAGTTGREDSQGRAFVELATPKEVVMRAFTMADMVVEELVVRDWVKTVDAENT